MPAGREVVKAFLTGVGFMTFDISTTAPCTHIGFWNSPKGGIFYGAIPVNFSTHIIPGTNFRIDSLSVDTGSNTDLILSIYEPVYTPSEGYFQPTFQEEILRTTLHHNLYLYISLHTADPLDTGANEFGTPPNFDPVYKRFNIRENPGRGAPGYWFIRRV